MAEHCVSNLFNIFAGVHGQEPMWLESAVTLADAQLRVQQISTVFPGAYFIFNTATGKVVYQTPTVSLSDRRFTEMRAARQEWERASEELKQALKLSHDLDASSASTDGTQALRNALLRETWTLKKYRAAVEAYSAAEIGARKPPKR
jgi:hypothetical protein